MADEQVELEKLINKRQKVQEAFSKGAAKAGLAPPTGILPPVKNEDVPNPAVGPKKVKKGWW